MWLLLWYRDTAGAKSCDSVDKVHFRKVQGLLLVYDVTNRKTFDNLPKWIQHLKKVLLHCTVVGVIF